MSQVSFRKQVAQDRADSNPKRVGYRFAGQLRAQFTPAHAPLGTVALVKLQLKT